MHEHARLARTERTRKQSSYNSSQQRKFKADPMKFGRSLFEKKSNGKPEFEEHKAYDYFSNLYRDKARGDKVTPMCDMKSPANPSHLFSEEAPTLAEISSVMKTKRNKAAPGLDGLSYVPYKCCPSILPILVSLFGKIWSTKEIPTDWAAASVQLLAKSTNLTEPSEFRPIALTNTIGKIFFAVIAKRLEKFMLANKFLSNSQKGFKASTPGCLEHSFAMFEALVSGTWNHSRAN